METFKQSGLLNWQAELRICERHPRTDGTAS